MPLAFLHGETVCSYLPGDTSFVAAPSAVGEIWVFLVYRGVRGDSAHISRPDGPIGIIPFFSISSQVTSTATYGFVSIAPVVVARRPPLPAPHAAPQLVHPVPPSILRRASRFLGIL
ncbi:hypothetical protein PISMIDRAFT_364691 [Pisolithus microcarpus 441]|uniref:Uncharacterized protein n=1 Tax=Pisolithus microcarpus 441 TaxID=765257 RepID=A0A0C9YJT2_9AGAM|nr:hypothetical protein BKA83DRAFT_364691 [Pisolithus microcarpus]KIK14039.1 hypothetical protein PISMIDRAFT_364691 [Pisolithus microcarpus 441]